MFESALLQGLAFDFLSLQFKCWGKVNIALGRRKWEDFTSIKTIQK